MSWKAPITDRVFEDTVFARNNQGNSEHNKGALNYTDLNRIEDNYKYILERLGEEFYHIPHNSRNYTETVQTVIQPEIDENVYIKSTGTQYIDTGIIPTNDTVVKFKNFTPNDTRDDEPWEVFIGSQTADNATDTWQLRRYLYDYTLAYQIGSSSTVTAPMQKDCEIVLGTNSMTINGTEYSLTPSAISSTLPLWLFGCNQNGSLVRGAICSFSALEIWQGGVLVRDFIPAKDSDDVICLYDTVTETYFYNQGTGEFVLGTDNGQLECIESTGTQYIDTEIVPTENTKVVMDFQLTTPDTSNQCIFGVVGQFSFRWYGPGGYFRSNGLNLSDFSTDVASTARHTVVKDVLKTIIDDTYSVDTTAGTVSLSLYLFAQHTSSGALQYAKLKIYSCQIYENDILVRDYIPYCKNGIACLYDKVSGSYFYNAGTGDFVEGNAIITKPEPEISVEQITYTDWQEINIPWKSEIDRIRRNHNNLASLFLIKYGYTDIEKNQYLNYEEVNKIEDIDLKGEEAYEKMIEEYIPCGTISSGGDLF